MRTRRAASGVLLCALVAACGSTVRTGAGGTAVGTDGLSPVTSGTADTPTGSAGSTTGTGGSGAAGTSGTGSSGTGRSTGSAPTTSAPEPGAKPGVVVQAKAPILVGLPYVNAEQSQALLGSIGNGLAPGDVKGMATALINDVNRKGGVNGHPVKLITYEINTSQSQAQYEQAACTRFTQDYKVLVALGAGAGPNYLTCLTKRGAAVVGADQSNLTTASFEKLRYVLQTDAIALDRLARIQAEQFTAMKVFEPTSPTAPMKLGVLYFEQPEFAAAEKVLESELAKRGIKVTAREAFNYVAEVDDITRTESQVQNAVLKFRSQGITHVIAVETNAWLIGFFGVFASNQGYYPRYAYTSDEPLSNVAANVPARALEGSRFVGWLPAQDLTDVNTYPATAKSCIQFLRKAGYTVDSGNQRNDALNACETVGFVVAALKAGGEPVSRESLMRGARALRTSYDPVATFQLDVTRRYDGVSSIRQGAWQTACGCFAYTSGLIPIS